MTKIKLVFIALLALTLVACGSPEPNKPFLGKWVLDKEMTLQKNRGESSEFIPLLRGGLQALKFDISETEINTVMITALNKPDNKRELRELFARPDDASLQEDKSVKQERGQVSYKFDEQTVLVNIKGQKKIVTLDYTFDADPAKLTLKSSRSNGNFPPETSFLREGEYMIFRVPEGPGVTVNLYFTREGN